MDMDNARAIASGDNAGASKASIKNLAIQQAARFISLTA